MQKQVEPDVAIIGGGVAGLWLLNRLTQLGYSAILLEAGSLGGAQTHKAQGIIHGGMKYALQGVLNPASQAIADMPSLWLQCLQGRGEIDLSAVPILSEHQYLFSTGKLAGKLTGFFAQVALKGRVSELSRADYPLVFQHPQFKGLVYSLDEMAIDVPALVQALAQTQQARIFKIAALQAQDLQWEGQDRLAAVSVRSMQGEGVEVKAKQFIFTAGLGNELLTQVPTIETQRRPLHMVLVKTDFVFPVFAHCFGKGQTPRITITTHKAADGKTVWYLGGQIAEEGVARDALEQQACAKKELSDIFPWLDFSGAHVTSFLVDRAEPKQAGGKRPDYVTINEVGNVMVAWPTKLALAPCLAHDVIKKLTITPNACDLTALQDFGLPPLAKPVWDELL